MNRRKLFFAGGIGNSIEVFEAVIYAFLQPFVTKTFFPANLRENNLFFFLTVILPFLARPLGALIFGVIGDLKGRKIVLEYSMILSGVSCAFIALTPSYQDVGLFSFFSIITFRFIFGFAMSGEYNNSFLYLAEHSAPHNRGYILSWASFGVSFGIFMATLFAYIFSHLVEKEILPTWSFRLLFLLSTISLYIGYIARRDLSETAEFFISFPSFEKNKTKAICATARTEISGRLTECLKIILLSGFGTHITYSLLIYGPFHLKNYNVHSITLKDATLLIAVSSCISALVIPIVGKISDFIGRKLLLIISTIAITVLYLAFFFNISENHSYQELLLFYLVFGLFGAIFYCTAPAEIIDSLPNKMRSTVNGLLYGIPALIFGAFTLPFFQIWFQTYPSSPLFILLIAMPLVFLFWGTKSSLFKPFHKYMYPLERTKVS